MMKKLACGRSFLLLSLGIMWACAEEVSLEEPYLQPLGRWNIQWTLEQNEAQQQAAKGQSIYLLGSIEIIEGGKAVLQVQGHQNSIFIQQEEQIVLQWSMVGENLHLYNPVTHFELPYALSFKNSHYIQGNFEGIAVEMHRRKTVQP